MTPLTTCVSTFISDWRSVAEFTYFVAGILLPIGLVITYIQLRAVKRDSSLRIKRAASEKAIEASDRYSSKYIPDSDIFFKLREDKNLGTYRGVIGDFSPKSISEEHKPAAQLRFKETIWTKHLNELEQIAASLISGVGDESIAFNIIGRSYCKAVEVHYDIISLCRPHESQSFFQNTVELYKLWSSRLQKLELKSQKNRIDSKLSKIGDTVALPLEQRR